MNAIAALRARQAKSAAARRNHHLHGAVTQAAVEQNAPICEADANRIMVRARLALHNLLDGEANEQAFMVVACAINVGGARSEQIDGNKPALAVFDAAGEALTHAQRRNDVHGRYGLSGPEREHVKAAIEIYEQVLRASSPRQMHLAEQEVVRRHELARKRA